MLSLVVGLIILVGGIIVSLTRDVAVQWGALLSIVEFTIIVFAAYAMRGFSTYRIRRRGILVSR